MNEKYIALVSRKTGGSWNEPHFLYSHLKETAEFAAKFAQIFSSGKWAELFGLAHDTGKSNEQWQRYLIEKSGYGQDEAHLENKPYTVDYSTPSAKLIEEILRKCPGRFLSYCIAGYNSGLPDGLSDNVSFLENKLVK